jgi:hypothetical protein
MACARTLGLTTLPIVVVNADGYYESFKQMLDRVWLDQLLKLKPEEIVHFVSTAEDAVKWVEEQGKVKLDGLQPKLRKRESALKKSSFMDSPSLANWFSRLSSGASSDGAVAWDEGKFALPEWTIPFAMGGVTIGALIGACSLCAK